MKCRRCGTCCTAPDITTLQKPVGIRCDHLDENNMCAIYESRPEVCRNYLPDEVCTRVDASTLAERVSRYIRLFDLEAGDQG